MRQRELLQMALAKYGADVITAGSAAEASLWPSAPDSFPESA